MRIVFCVRALMPAVLQQGVPMWGVVGATSATKELRLARGFSLSLSLALSLSRALSLSLSLSLSLFVSVSLSLSLSLSLSRSLSLSLTHTHSLSLSLSRLMPHGPCGTAPYEFSVFF